MSAIDVDVKDTSEINRNGQTQIHKLQRAGSEISQREESEGEGKERREKTEKIRRGKRKKDRES